MPIAIEGANTVNKPKKLVEKNKAFEAAQHFSPSSKYKRKPIKAN